jgi:hypothetical protein
MHDAPAAAQISSQVFGVWTSGSGAVVKQDRPEPCTLDVLPTDEFSSGAGAQERSARGRKRMLRETKRNGPHFCGQASPREPS